MLPSGCSLTAAAARLLCDDEGDDEVVGVRVGGRRCVSVWVCVFETHVCVCVCVCVCVYQNQADEQGNDDRARPSPTAEAG